MRAGRLRHRVTLQEQRGAQSETGAVAGRWRSVATVYAELKPLAGTEGRGSEQMVAEVTHEVRIRYRRDVRPTMRLLYGARVLDVHSVLNTDERNAELVLGCREVVGEAP